jgi:hypothetical protein
MTGAVRHFESDLPETRRTGTLIMCVSLFGQSLQTQTYRPDGIGISSENPKIRIGLTIVVQALGPAKVERER